MSDNLDAKWDEHNAWLRSVAVPDGPISQGVIGDCLAMHLPIRSATGGMLPAPSAITNADGSVFYAWDRGKHHLSVDIKPGQPVEWFYCKRGTDEFWGEDWEIPTPLPGRVVEALKLFCEGLS